MPYKDPEVNRRYQRERAARRRAEWFSSKQCVDCGSTDRMELDHIDPATKVASSIWQWSAKRIEAEAAKCQVRCYKCHKKRTKIQVSVPVTHGTHTKGYARGCKCGPCTDAHAAYNRLH